MVYRAYTTYNFLTMSSSLDFYYSLDFFTDELVVGSGWFKNGYASSAGFRGVINDCLSTYSKKSKQLMFGSLYGFTLVANEQSCSFLRFILIDYLDDFRLFNLSR